MLGMCSPVQANPGTDSDAITHEAEPWAMNTGGSEQTVEAVLFLTPMVSRQSWLEHQA